MPKGSQNTLASIQSSSLFHSLVFLSHEPRDHDLPNGHITMMHRSAVAPLGKKAPCDLCQVIGAHSAACTTAKSGTKKCFHDRRGTVWTSFAFGFVSNPVCAVVVLSKTRILKRSARMLHATIAVQCFSFHTGMLQLPHRRLKTFPVSLQNEVRLFFHSFHFIAGSNSQPVAPTFFEGLFRGVLPSPQNIVKLQVSWQGFFSLIPSLVQSVAVTDDGLLAPLLSLALL